MRIIELPVGETSPRTGITRIINEARQALRNFCQAKVIETKLAPSSFNFVFDFHESRRSSKKSIDRISAMLKRKILKRMPFLEFARGDAVRSVTGGGGVAIDICLPEVKSDRTYGTTPRNIKGNINKFKRYVRYINYLSRKYGAPMSVSCSVNYEYSTEEQERMSRFNSEQLTSENNFPMYIPVVNIRLNLSTWVMSAPEHYHEFKESFLAGGDLDRIFASQTKWSFTPLLDAGTFGSDFEGVTPLENLFTPERAFLFVPQIVQVLSTLSKESTYDFRAFSFRAAEMPSDQSGVHDSATEVQPAPQADQ